MGSDLTYAVVGGVLENILMGFDARDAQKKKEAEDAAKKAEKEAENLFTNSNNLVAHLSHKDNRGAAVSFIHATAVPNSPASMVYNSLDCVSTDDHKHQRYGSSSRSASRGSNTSSYKCRSCKIISTRSDYSADVQYKSYGDGAA